MNQELLRNAASCIEDIASSEPNVRWGWDWEAIVRELRQASNNNPQETIDNHASVVVTFTAYPVDENTPKDREIALFLPTGWVHGRWNTQFEIWCASFHGPLFDSRYHPTHWCEVSDMNPPSKQTGENK